MADEPTPTPLTDAEREAAADLINDALLDDGHSGFACDPARPLDYTAESVLDRLLASDWFAVRVAAARADVVAAMQQTIDELWATCESLSNDLAAARAVAELTTTPLTWAEGMELTHLPARPKAIAAHILASEWHAHIVAAARADERERLARLVEQYDRQGYLFPCADVAWWLRSRDALTQPAADLPEGWDAQSADERERMSKAQPEAPPCTCDTFKRTGACALTEEADRG